MSAPTTWSCARATLGLCLLLATPAMADTPAATDLQISVTAVTFQVGATGRYSITVVNRGPGATNDPISVSTILPSGLSAISATNGWVCEPNGTATVCTSTAPLASQTTTAFALLVNVGMEAVPRVAVRFAVGYAGDTNSANNATLRMTSVRPPRRPLPTATRTPSTAPSFGTPVPSRTPTRTVPPTRTTTATMTRTATSTRTPVPNSTDVSLKKTNFGAFKVGSNGTYTLAVTNLGLLETNTPLTVVDQLPNGLTYVSATGTDWQCGAVGQQVTCVRDTPLASLTTINITLVVAVGEAAYPTLTNAATLTYLGDTDTTNNLSRKPTTVKR